MAEPTVREALEQAINASAAPEAPAAPAPSPAPSAPPAAPAPVAAPAPAPADAAASSGTSVSGTVREPGQASLPLGKPERSPFAPQPKFGEQAKPAAAAAAPAPGAALAPELKAPASWKADLREKWKALPPEVQSEVIRRERENDARMQEAAQLRKFAQDFQQVAEPYRAIIEAEGAHPLQAFHDYLKTATLLRSGPPMEKARLVAQLIHRFGVPVQALDQYLEAAIRGGALPAPGLPSGAQQFAQQPPVFRDPRVDQLLARMEAAQRSQVAQSAEQFAADPKHEFFEDVRLTMADVMDAAAKRGIVMSLDDAYERACQIEPEVRKVLQARGAQGNASQAARTLAAARHAASSVPSAGAAPAAKTNGSAKPGSVRDAILQSIDTLTNAA